MTTHQRRTRIGLDCHAVSQLFQGSRTWLLELFPRVAALMPDAEFVVFSDDPRALAQAAPKLVAPNVQFVAMPLVDPVRRLCVQLPILETRHRLDLLHTQFIAPVFNLCKTVVTVHDLLFESHPEYFEPMFRLRSRVLIRRSARTQASHVFTASEFSKRELMARYRLHPEKITMAYPGVDPCRFFPGGEGDSIVRNRGLQPGGYLLSVGRLEPRKNYATLMQSYAALAMPKPPLVIVGQRHFRFDPVIQLAKRLKDERIIILEDVDDCELPALYRHAKLFLFPSWAEGFGIPVLEALASGVPTIASNTTAIPEVVGDAGILLDPADGPGLTAAISSLLANETLRNRLRELGPRRAERFSWDRAAVATADVYARTLGLARQAAPMPARRPLRGAISRAADEAT